MFFPVFVFCYLGNDFDDLGVPWLVTLTCETWMLTLLTTVVPERILNIYSTLPITGFRT